MDQLEGEELLVEGTRHNIVNNQVCVVTYEGSNTQVTGLEDLNKASSIALADGSVPVGNIQEKHWSMQAFWRKQTTYRPSQPSRFPKRSAAWKSMSVQT